MKNIDELYKLYIKSLNMEERKKLLNFWNTFHKHCNLSKAETKKMINDFKAAFVFYKDNDVSFKKALQLLNCKNLGDFYNTSSRDWYPLEDAAKIYPISMNHGQMAVYRISALLYKNIVPEILQIALTFTIKRFPSFATTVKKGFFWHYLNPSKRRFSIEKESGMPCQVIKIGYSNSQTFRVIYYKNRLSIEFFHILTDGTGSMIFLKSLISKYLELLGNSISYENEVLNTNDKVSPDELENSFDLASTTKKQSGFFNKIATQMSGKISKTLPSYILHFRMNSTKLKKISDKNNCTLTAYILDKIFIAQKKATYKQSGNIAIQVPVNMRKYYKSKTLRNFSLYCNINLNIKDITQNNIEKISKQLKIKSSKDSMEEMMSSTKKMVNSIRFIPLFLKTPLVKLVYFFIGERIFSNTLSNLSVLSAPDELKKHISVIDASLGSSKVKRSGCTLITFKNITTLTITKMTKDSTFEDELYKLLRNDGLNIYIEGSHKL